MHDRAFPVRDARIPTTRPPPPIRAIFIPNDYRAVPFLVEAAQNPDGSLKHARADGIYVAI